MYSYSWLLSYYYHKPTAKQYHVLPSCQGAEYTAIEAMKPILDLERLLTADGTPKKLYLQKPQREDYGN